MILLRGSGLYKLSPIVLFVYNRLGHTQLTLEALQNNILAKDSDLYIYSDAARDSNSKIEVNKVRDFLVDINGFKSVTVVRRNTNYGLAKSIISGVTNLINKHGRVIVLEDDLITSPYFLNYMNEALDTYEHRADIFSVTGFSFPLSTMKTLSSSIDEVYLNVRPMSWSWATWSNRWSDVDWKVSDFKRFSSDRTAIKEFNKGGTDLSNMLDRQMKGKLDSWYIRWSYYAYKIRGYTVYPRISFVNNIGHDDTGVHCVSNINQVFTHNELNESRKINMQKNIRLNQLIVGEFNDKFNLSVKSKVKQSIRRMIGL